MKGCPECVRLNNELAMISWKALLASWGLRLPTTHPLHEVFHARAQRLAYARDAVLAELEAHLPPPGALSLCDEAGALSLCAASGALSMKEA